MKHSIGISTKRIALLFCGCLLFAIAPVFGQWDTVSVDDLQDIIGDNYRFDKATLSPSGERVAWFEADNGLCLFVFAYSEPKCYGWPWADSYVQSYPTLVNLYLAWSPDEQYIAFAKNPFADLPFDSDIWVFDIANEAFSNLTDDGIAGWYRQYPDGLTPEVLDAFVDFMPIWDTHSDSLYFFRITPTDTGFTGLALYQVSISDQTELVYDFSDQFKPSGLKAAINPDGNRMVLALKEADSSEGVWLLNLTDQTIHRISSVNDLNIGWPEWVNTLSITGTFSAVDWLSNEEIIVLVQGASIDESLHVDLLPNYLLINLQTAEVRPIIDVSQIVLGEAADQVAFMPYESILSPSPDTLFFLSLDRRSGQAQMLKVDSLSNTDFTSAIIGAFDIFSAPHDGFIFRIRDNGKALVRGRTLITFEVFESENRSGAGHHAGSLRHRPAGARPRRPLPGAAGTKAAATWHRQATGMTL